jgi:P27 family predicted phage terminase small subunit
MKRGPKPKPPRLRLLNGNASKRPLPEPSLKAKASIPEAPKFLTLEARREWKRITRALGALGSLTEFSLSDLTCYCRAWGRLAKAERKLKTKGEVLRGLRNGGQYQNPWLAVAKQAAMDLAKFGSRLGLDSIAPSAEPQDELEDFLNGPAAS